MDIKIQNGMHMPVHSVGSQSPKGLVSVARGRSMPHAAGVASLCNSKFQRQSHPLDGTAPRLQIEHRANQMARFGSADVCFSHGDDSTIPVLESLPAAPVKQFSLRMVTAVPDSAFLNNPIADPMEKRVYRVVTPNAQLFGRVSYGGPGSKYDEICEDSIGMGARVDGSTLAFVLDGAGGAELGGHLYTVAANASITKALKKGASLEAAIRMANHQIFTAYAMETYGTVAGVEVSATNRVTPMAVGDACVVTIRAGQYFEPGSTKMHNLVQELIDKGEIPAEDYYTHPRNNVLKQAVGTAASIQPSMPKPFQGLLGDLIVLGSDGLFDIVTPYEMAELSKQHKTASSLQKAIFSLAYVRNQSRTPYTIQFSATKKIEMRPRYKNGDNISVVVVEITTATLSAQTMSDIDLLDEDPPTTPLAQRLPLIETDPDEEVTVPIPLSTLPLFTGLMFEIELGELYLVDKSKRVGKIQGFREDNGEEFIIFTGQTSGEILKFKSQDVLSMRVRGDDLTPLFSRVRTPQFRDKFINMSGPNGRKMWVLLDYANPKLVGFLEQHMKPIFDQSEAGILPKRAVILAQRAIVQNIRPDTSRLTRPLPKKLYSLGDFLDKGVCNEMAMLLQVSLQYMGIDSQMEKGLSPQSDEIRHAWVRLQGADDREALILDPARNTLVGPMDTSYKKYVVDPTPFIMPNVETLTGR